MVETALGVAAGLGWWFVGVAVLLVCGDFQWRRQHSATTAHRALPVCELSVLDIPWGTARSNAALAVCSRHGRAYTGGFGRAGQVVVCGGAVLPVCGNFQRRSNYSATTAAHRALPVCDLRALSMPSAIVRTNSASVECRSNGGACTGAAAGLGRWFVWRLRFCRFVEISRGGGSTRQPQRTEPCQCVGG